MRAAVVWASGAALILAAGVVTVITPDPDTQVDAFLVRGTVEQTIPSRNLTVRIEDVRFADRVTVSDDDWAADGTWLVVELSAEAPRTELDAAMRLIKLIVDGRDYIASERPSTSLVGVDLRVGMDTSGMVAFELPPGLAAETAELRLSLAHRTPHLDDVIVVPLDLGGAPREDIIDIVEPATPEVP